MEYSGKIESKLGFDRLRNYVKNACSTQYAQKRTLEETVSSDPETIERRLALSDEMRVIMMFEASFPSAGYVDCINFLTPLKEEYSSIDVNSLRKLKESLDTLRKLLNFFDNVKEGKYPLLKKMSEPILSFPEILRRIDLILDKYGEIRDNASEDLAAIRKAIKATEGSVSRKIQTILKQAQLDGIADEDASVSVRDGKMLIPVNAGNKKKIPGLVCGESSSGKTSFIEPLEVVELNNRIREMHFDEQREILKIMVEFTDFLRPYIEDVILSQQYMGELDFIRAKTEVAMRYDGGMPVISTAGELILKKGRHPLLEEALKKEGKEIVPLDIVLNSQKRILLISGPNAGGKSVCLKTVGLLQYMFQWGMLIPASPSSELMIFDDIFIDIGDDQSLESDLSTYSSHLMNMKEVIEGADDRSLVLIDEFGSGTEPAAGGAIAEEILSELEERGSYGVITTHYTNLKFFAGNSKRVINGAMLFDVQKIMPLFKLEIGLPGNSFAFELARKIGLPEDIVHGAEERAGSDYVTIERNLRKIARNKKKLEDKLIHIKATDKTLDNITQKYEQELTDIKSIRKGIIDEAKAEAREILSQANKKIENTIREIRESQAEKVKTAELRKDLKEFTESVAKNDAAKSARDEELDRKMAQIIERKKRQQERRAKREAARGEKTVVEKNNVNTAKKDIPAAPEVGSYVKIAGSDIVGEVMNISGTVATVAMGNIITKAELKKLTCITSNQYRTKIKPAPRVSSLGDVLNDRRLNFKPSIDIRGMRLDEAIPVVTRFIDDALVLGMGEVSILHGKGSGILKDEIRKILKITPGVVSFADEHVERGGSGITIVQLQ